MYRPIVCTAVPPQPQDKKPALARVQRIRREWEAKRIDNLKQIQAVFRKTAEDDLETMLALVRGEQEKKDE